MPIETVHVDALDGVRLEADLVRVEEPCGSVVLSHPHPLYGGDRFNPVVDTLFRALPDAGFAVVRFDFRGVNQSGGSHDDGDAERLDVVAALELLEWAQPDTAIHLVGCSFGSIVALNVVDPRVSSWVAIAPPLATMVGPCLAASDHRRKLLLIAAHDQFSPPAAVAPIVASWQATDVRTIESADHFLGGRLGVVADLVVEHLQSLPT
jgi:uncharacterized protein